MTTARLAVAALAVAAAGCDAMSSARLDARVAASDGSSAVGGTLRAFWFDDAENARFAEPIDEQVKRIGDERWHRPSRGTTQTEWQTAPIADDGSVRMMFKTFYAGGLPFSNLLGRERESDPVGLWLEIDPADARALPQAFIVRDVDGVPTLVRLRFESALWKPADPAGPVGVDKHTWSIVVPLEAWERK